MKDSLLEALMRLFDEHLSTHSTKSAASATTTITSTSPEWNTLSTLEQNTQFIRPAYARSKRLFSPEERMKLTKKSHQFLEQLIQLELIGEYTLELIINQLLFSESSFVHLDETKWTIEQTLADNLDETQLAFLNLVLYDKEDQVLQH